MTITERESKGAGSGERGAERALEKGGKEVRMVERRVIKIEMNK